MGNLLAEGLGKPIHRSEPLVCAQVDNLASKILGERFRGSMRHSKKGHILLVDKRRVLNRKHEISEERSRELFLQL